MSARESQSSTPEVGRSFGDGWVPDADALAIVQNYLMDPPEQGDWAWADHVEGLAGGILSALHDAGFELAKGEPPDAHLWDPSLYGRTE